MNALRLRAPLALRGVRQLHASRAAWLKAGDAVPNTILAEGAPSKKVNLAEETKKGKYLVVGVPGAFSPGCSASHVPGYLNNFEKFANKGIDGIFVVAVNDSFVTGAWQQALALENSTGDNVRFLADASGDFTKAWDVAFDAAPFFGNHRSKRYAAIVENGKVVKEFVEPDSTGISISAAEKVLGTL